MKIHNLKQGTKDWRTFRATHLTASEAPSMMGEGFKKRDEYIKSKALGLEDEITPRLQQLFDDGHAAEAASRPLIEEIYDIELSPVTGTHDTDEEISASLDGLSVCETINWEHKLRNKDLVTMIANKKLSPKYWIQLEQQMYVSGADKTIFSCSNKDGSELIHMEYKPVKGRIKKILAAWEQFKIDKAAFLEYNQGGYIEGECTVFEIEETSIETLPELTYKMNGLALTSNLEVYKKAAFALVERSKIKIETDQDFADCDAFNKKLREAQKALEAMQEKVMAEAADINTFRTDIGAIAESLRKAALAGEKQVKDRKDEIRAEKINKYREKYEDFIETLSSSLGSFYFRKPAPDFATAMKGLKTIDSLDSACNDHLAELKTAANMAANTVKENALFYAKEAQGFEQLFHDIADLAANNEEDAFNALVENRILNEKARLQEAAEKQKQRDQEELAKQKEIETQANTIAPEPDLASMPNRTLPPETATSPSAQDKLVLEDLAKRFRELVLPEMQSELGKDVIKKTRAYLQTLGDKIEAQSRGL